MTTKTETHVYCPKCGISSLFTGNIYPTPSFDPIWKCENCNTEWSFQMTEHNEEEIVKWHK